MAIITQNESFTAGSNGAYIQSGEGTATIQKSSTGVSTRINMSELSYRGSDSLGSEVTTNATVRTVIDLNTLTVGPAVGVLSGNIGIGGLRMNYLTDPMLPNVVGNITVSDLEADIDATNVELTVPVIDITGVPMATSTIMGLNTGLDAGQSSGIYIPADTVVTALGSSVIFIVQADSAVADSEIYIRNEIVPEDSIIISGEGRISIDNDILNLNTTPFPVTVPSGSVARILGSSIAFT